MKPEISLSDAVAHACEDQRNQQQMARNAEHERRTRPAPPPVGGARGPRHNWARDRRPDPGITAANAPCWTPAHKDDQEQQERAAAVRAAARGDHAPTRPPEPGEAS